MLLLGRMRNPAQSSMTLPRGSHRAARVLFVVRQEHPVSLDHAPAGITKVQELFG